MPFRLAPTDLEILRAIAECRMMTAPQLAAFLNRSKKGIRDRIGRLISEGLLEEATRGRGQRRGRPERILFLSEPAIVILKERGIVDPEVRNDDIVGKHISCQSHQLLLNWARIHLIQVERVLPRLRVNFLAYNSPFLPPEFSDPSIIMDPVPGQAKPQRMLSFRPDATFSIIDKDQDKAVLFFLEVDMGTETLASPRRGPADIRQKILNYGACFDTLAYKRYEKLWDCQLTDTFPRLSTLSSLVREMAPSDFIWLTDKDRMFKDGISSNIWVRGGHIDASPQSILGSLTRRAPLE